MERGALPVINMQPFDVVKFFCPHCMSLQHLLSAPPEMHPESRPINVYASRDINHQAS